MRKFLAVCSCLILVSLLLVSRQNVYSQQADKTQSRYASDRIMVKLKAGIEPVADLDQMGEGIIGARTRVERLSVEPSGAGGGLQLMHLDNVSVEEAVRRASEDPRVEYAEPDYYVHAMDTIPNDPRFSEMWGLSSTPGQQTSNIDAPQAWDLTQGDNNTVAVVLDQGVDLQHVDLAANAWVNPFEIPGNGRDDDGNGFVDDVNGWNFFDGNNQVFKGFSEDFHGTHVAGTIGAVGHNNIGVTGVAWHVKIMALKFLSGNADGSVSAAVRGINYAIDMRNRGVNVRVINASWGGSRDSQSLRQAITAAGNAGIIFVAAAGNGGDDGLGDDLDRTPDFPGAYAKDLSNVISVAAVDENGKLARFSNFGHNSGSLAAPGVSILSTFPGGNYNLLSGTSMATPHVSGIAVLLWSRNSSLTPAEVKKRIIDTSDPLPSLVSILARSGRANAYAALRYPDSIPPAPSPVVVSADFSKKWITIDGFGILNGSSMIEADGIALPAGESADYDASFALANGTLTRLSIYLGKKPMKRTFPSGVPVSINLFNPTTGERSPSIIVTRP